VKSSIACSIVVVIVFPAPGVSKVLKEIPLTPAASCAAMGEGDFSLVPEAPTQVTKIARMDRSGGLPPYCFVEGYVSPQVGFEIRLPEVSWNGKFIHLGSGGHGGTIWSEACVMPLQRGYACLLSDMGHKGTGLDSGWAHNSIQAEIDWGYRATHVATLAGKAIAARYYGREPTQSYFSGCSTGGRQGLQEAQRFPWDYDGIIAGAPPVRLSDLYVTFAWSALANRDAAGKDLLRREDLNGLTAAAVAKCDMDDGVKDGIISQPLRCPFKPSELACHERGKIGCLNPAQVTAAENIYSGPVDSTGRRMFGGGALPGSESGWARYYLDDPQGRRPYMFALTSNGIRDLFSFPELEPSWTIESFRFDQDYKRMDVMQALYDSSNPDLTRFKAAGGRLMMYMGMNDVSMPHTAIDYYQKVERLMGGKSQTQEFARLFLLPGVEHCMGGPGADQVDYLTYLEDWVEHAKPPDRLVAYHLKSGSEAHPMLFPPDEQSVEFSRPVYPYPLLPRYTGRGDPTSAASFKPVTAADDPHRPRTRSARPIGLSLRESAPSGMPRSASKRRAAFTS